MFKNDQNGAIDLIFVSALVMVLAVGGLVYLRISNINEIKPLEAPVDNDANIVEIEPMPSEAKLTQLDTGTFKYTGHDFETAEGIFQAYGYITKEDIPEPFCTQDCTEFETIFFNVTQTPNQYIEKFLESYDGNTFGGPLKFSIGCYEDSKITSTNSNDEYTWSTNEINEEDSKILEESSGSSIVAVEVERLLLTYGKDAPPCYSHFHRIEVL